MKKELTNAFGKVFLTTEFDKANNYWYNDWQGYQTLEGVMMGANTYLNEMAKHPCPLPTQRQYQCKRPLGPRRGLDCPRLDSPRYCQGPHALRPRG